MFQTRESEQLDDDSYLGYSTITGDFLGTGEQGIAVGMPRGAELHGKVSLNLPQSKIRLYDSGFIGSSVHLEPDQLQEHFE